MRVLIVGSHSYIARHFMSYVGQYHPSIELGTITVRDANWNKTRFEEYDVVVYFSAIVHHPDITDEGLYDEVNAEIPKQMASLARLQGVKHFIYLSTVGVWGLGPKFNYTITISKDTPLKPNSLYGVSKLKGEQQLLAMATNSFIVTVIRLPNVYGENCPGTFYQRLRFLSHLYVLPVCKEKRPFSIISVGNVARALLNTISKELSGIICPQDPEIISIVDRIREMAQNSGRRQVQFRVNSQLLSWFYKMNPNKYMDNLYGGYYIDTNSFPNIL
ncbi:NAD-dependent epimerase/dehydratase family protein [Prevotella sp. kh1p2]|uniref:NAD-dependent epimerase/dehydratase family protein n=1 Tax=Prevotella sp. kh1p2 TaxID=1761883 RepID=UPI0008C390D3|nr:NAD-dependent epimerase/dehydratase family protein [Prevotella sp. kh1p2]SET11064.1 UDP-glucose 4-epimerase [Prevotella sp. kh1p2]SNU11829.1 UDP-glucose 4-epimerase [Prevotellaceae bacterium KH2P17]